MDEVRCPRCDKQIPTSAQYCRRCGCMLAPQPPDDSPRIEIQDITPPSPPRMIKPLALAPPKPRAVTASGGKAGAGSLVFVGIALAVWYGNTYKPSPPALPKPLDLRHQWNTTFPYNTPPRVNWNELRKDSFPVPTRIGPVTVTRGSTTRDTWYPAPVPPPPQVRPMTLPKAPPLGPWDSQPQPSGTSPGREPHK